MIYSDADYLNSKKTDHMYLEVVSEAVELASWWIRHSVPYGLLKEKQIAVDGKTTSLILPSGHKVGQSLCCNQTAAQN